MRVGQPSLAACNAAMTSASYRSVTDSLGEADFGRPARLTRSPKELISRDLPGFFGADLVRVWGNGVAAIDQRVVFGRRHHAFRTLENTSSLAAVCLAQADDMKHVTALSEHHAIEAIGDEPETTLASFTVVVTNARQPGFDRTLPTNRMQLPALETYRVYQYCGRAGWDLWGVSSGIAMRLIAVTQTHNVTCYLSLRYQKRAARASVHAAKAPVRRGHAVDHGKGLCTAWQGAIGVVHACAHSRPRRRDLNEVST